MNEKLFAELMQSAHEALAHAQGKQELRTTVLPPPPPPMDAAQVRRLRTRLKASQAVFAHYLNVSTKLVQAWESARRTPDGPALVLLRLTEQNPAVLLASYDVPAGVGRRLAAKGTRRAPRNGRYRSGRDQTPR